MSFTVPFFCASVAIVGLITWKVSLGNSSSCANPCRTRFVRRGEIHRVRGRLGKLSSDQEDVVESLSRGIIEKVLQAPVAMLLNAAAANQSAFILETVRRIFNLRL